MELNLKDKVALVTGGSRGIGAAICKALAAEGAKVGVGYSRGQDEANAVVAAIGATYGTDAIALRGDMANEQDVLGLFDAMTERFGRVDILINNAAYCPSGWIDDYTWEEWERTFRINVTGAFAACREFVRRATDDERGGKIVNIASQAAFRGSTSGHLPYDSSKGALVSMTLSLAREVSAKGINVNAVAPGLVLTEMVAEKWEQNKDRYLSRIPIGRIATPEEIANATVFLASDAASYITGATLDVSGGMMMR